MTPLVPVALFGWVLVVIVLFYVKDAQRAVVAAVVGGVLFLPMTGYEFPLIGEYSKVIAISVGILIAERVSGKRGAFPLKARAYDAPMILWCFVAPFATSLTNGLGLYEGFAGAVQTYLYWGVFYWAGRRYFADRSSLRALSRAMIIGGAIYIPLILFELRMSPMLSKMVYGFFPSSFIQHIRYGAYRPIVFMQHGLMVALWMAASTTATFWLWRTKQVKTILGVSGAIAFAALGAMTILCRSANGWTYLALGIVLFWSYRKKKSTRLIRLLLLVVPIYVFSRITKMISYEQVQAWLGNIFDPDRIISMTARLRQEDLFGARALQRPLFGWGGYQRGWPIDPDTGAKMLQAVDSFWVITFSTNGLFGMACAFLSIGIGPWLALSPVKKGGRAGDDGDPYGVDVVAISVVVTLFLIDCLMNLMFNPVYVLFAGALVSNYCARGDRTKEPAEV